MRVPSLIDGRILDEIRLQDLQVRCTIGIYPDEAARTQLLRLNLVLYLDTRAAANSGRLQHSVDYAALSRELNFILTHARFRLLESAAEALAAYILSPHKPRASIEAVELEIVKPEALKGAAIPSVKIFRHAPLPQAVDLPSRATALIFATPEAALLRFVVQAGASTRLLEAGWKVQAILTEEAGLKCDGRELSAATTLSHEQLEASSFVNEDSEPKTLMAVAHRESRPSQKRPEAFGYRQPIYN